MNKEFINAYLNIITEAWDRFEYLDIIRATNIVTNNCQDSWVKGESGSKIFALLKDSGTKRRGAEQTRFGGLVDKDADYLSTDEIEKAKDEGKYYDGSASNDDNYIMSYWQARSKSGNSFDQNILRSIRRYSNTNDYRKDMVVAAEVGGIAYGIWKALNSRSIKNQANTEYFEKNPFEYSEGQKIENLDLIVKDVKTNMQSSYGYGSYSQSTELVCEDPKSGIKYKLRLGKNTSKKLADLLNYIKSDSFREALESTPELENIKKINVSGKVLRINKEWKSVTLNFVTINSPSDSEVDVVEKIIRDKKHELEESKKASKKTKETVNLFKVLLESFKKHPDSEIKPELIENLNKMIDEIPDEEYDKLTMAEQDIISQMSKFCFDHK